MNNSGTFLEFGECDKTEKGLEECDTRRRSLENVIYGEVAWRMGFTGKKLGECDSQRSGLENVIHREGSWRT